jgi:hypothetical protein
MNTVSDRTCRKEESAKCAGRVTTPILIDLAPCTSGIKMYSSDTEE